MVWLYMLIAVLFVVAFFFITKLVKEGKITKDKMQSILSGASLGSDVAKTVIDIFDKDKEHESKSELLFRYIDSGVKSVEKRFSKVKDKIDDPAERDKINEEMKAGAIELAEGLARTDNVELSTNDKKVMEGLIDTALFSLDFGEKLLDKSKEPAPVDS